MTKLAIDGGEKIFSTPAHLPAWPPVYPETAEKLKEIYLSRAWSFYGPQEVLFNQKFAEYTGAGFCAMMANGTVTLELALKAFGIGPGDEVIVPAETWLATGEAVVYRGATPVIVDIEPDTYCMDPDKFEEAITPRTKAVIPVHLFGSMANMDRIMEIARKHNIKVVEDCAHAHGSEWRGKHAGTIGDVGSFSFQQSKTMASGEGGACLTNDPELAEVLGRLSHIGYQYAAKQGQKGTPPPMELVCHNYRVTDFQAAILLGQLEHLKEDTILREKNAEYLRKRIDALPGFKVQARGKEATLQGFYTFAFHMIPDQFKEGIDRVKVINAITAEGFGCYAAWGGQPMYRQNLWSVPENQYRIASNAVAEDLCTNRLIMATNPWLMLDEKELAMVGDIFEKVMTAYGK